MDCAISEELKEETEFSFIILYEIMELSLDYLKSGPIFIDREVNPEWILTYDFLRGEFTYPTKAPTVDSVGQPSYYFEANSPYVCYLGTTMPKALEDILNIDQYRYIKRINQLVEKRGIIIPIIENPGFNIIQTIKFKHTKINRKEVNERQINLF